MIYLDEESSTHLKPYVKLEKCGIQTTDQQHPQYSVHPRDLIEYLMESFIYLITEYFKAFDWHELKDELTAADRKAVEESMEEYNRDIGRYLGIGSDPMYFW